MADIPEEGYFQDSKRIAAWKLPEQAQPPMISSSPAPRKLLRPQYDSAIEAYGRGAGLGKDGKFAPTAEGVTADESAEETPSIPAPLEGKALGERTGSERLLALVRLLAPSPRVHVSLCRKYGKRSLDTLLFAFVMDYDFRFMPPSRLCCRSGQCTARNLPSSPEL